MNKKWFKIYGTAPDGIEYHLATVSSIGNTCAIVQLLSSMYKDVHYK